MQDGDGRIPLPSSSSWAPSSTPCWISNSTLLFDSGEIKGPVGRVIKMVIKISVEIILNWTLNKQNIPHFLTDVCLGVEPWPDCELLGFVDYVCYPFLRLPHENHCGKSHAPEIAIQITGNQLYIKYAPLRFIKIFENQRGNSPRVNTIVTTIYTSHPKIVNIVTWQRKYLSNWKKV